MRVQITAAASLLLLGCHSELRKRIDPGGYQQMRQEEQAEEREREKKEWTRKCRELLAERRQQLDALVAEVETATPQGEDGLKALRTDWDGRAKQLLQDIPRQCDDEPQKRDYDAFLEHYHGEKDRIARAMVDKAIAAGAPRQGRTILFTHYNEEVNTKDARLEGQARQIAALYDAHLLERFEKYGGYGKLGAPQDKVGCVFSEREWPEDLGEVEPRFTTHFTGREVPVYALCRLPLPAKRYARDGARFYVQLLSAMHGTIDVASSYERGTPETIGDTPYVRAAFELPPNQRFDHSRYFFDVRVVFVWNTGSGEKSQVLSQSSFTWQATD